MWELITNDYSFSLILSFMILLIGILLVVWEERKLSYILNKSTSLISKKEYWKIYIRTWIIHLLTFLLYFIVSLSLELFLHFGAGCLILIGISLSSLSTEFIVGKKYRKELREQNRFIEDQPK